MLTSAIMLYTHVTSPRWRPKHPSGLHATDYFSPVSSIVRMSLGSTNTGRAWALCTHDMSERLLTTGALQESARPGCWSSFQRSLRARQERGGQAALQHRSAPGRPHISATCSTDELTAWLHVTNVCNLRCPYCYMRQTHEVKSEETG